MESAENEARGPRRWLNRNVLAFGLTSFLSASLGEKVVPFEFNTRTKSDLCWNFIGIIESGRFKDHKQTLDCKEQTEFWRQISFCEFNILPGPQKTVRWGVPDGTRDPADGELVHDDLLISAALVAALDEQDWTVAGPTLVVPSKDPLEELDKGF